MLRVLLLKEVWLVGKEYSSVCPFINSLLSLQGYLSDLDMQCRMFVQHILGRSTCFYSLVKLYFTKCQTVVGFMLFHYYSHIIRIFMIVVVYTSRLYKRLYKCKTCNHPNSGFHIFLRTVYSNFETGYFQSTHFHITQH